MPGDTKVPRTQRRVGDVDTGEDTRGVVPTVVVDGSLGPVFIVHGGSLLGVSQFRRRLCSEVSQIQGRQWWYLDDSGRSGVLARRT